MFAHCNWNMLKSKSKGITLRTSSPFTIPEIVPQILMLTLYTQPNFWLPGLCGSHRKYQQYSTIFNNSGTSVRHFAPLLTGSHPIARHNVEKKSPHEVQKSPPHKQITTAQRRRQTWSFFPMGLKSCRASAFCQTSGLKQSCFLINRLLAQRIGQSNILEFLNYLLVQSFNGLDTPA